MRWTRHEERGSCRSHLPSIQLIADSTLAAGEECVIRTRAVPTLEPLLGKRAGSSTVVGAALKWLLKGRNRMEQVLLTGVRQCWLKPSLPVQAAPRPAETQRRLRLPGQSKPVNRSKALQPFTVAYQVGTNPDGSPIMNYVEQAAPFPDSQDPFSNRVDQRLGICPVLSSYAVARCFRAGGLF